MNFDKYTDRSRGFLESAQALAQREGHQQFSPEHLLKVLLDDSEGLAAGLIDRAGGNSRAALAATEAALAKLRRATAEAPGSFEAWHALAEANFSARRFEAALAAAERAHALRPDDVFANVTLSRAWMEMGDKAKAEHFGAQARMQGWKEELRRDPGGATP